MAVLTINKYYNFSVFANPVLGNSYKNAKLISILDYKMALKFANIELLHRQVYPYLPPDSLSDATKYTYYVFEYNNKTIVLASIWLIQESIEETSGISINMRLNNISEHQLTIISNQLRLLGISFDIL